MSEEILLTQEGYDKIVAELEDLVAVRRKEISERLKEAISYGDLSENAEYEEAKNEQGRLFSRKAEIENILMNAEVIEVSDNNSEVHTGSHVKVCDISDDSIEEYWVVGSQEADPYKGRISDESPFGKALIGKAVGDIVNVEAPCGIIEYKIVEIGN